ncbi:hypothetical protein DFP72DRAFT_1075405 [Ephemerocybe angulata]|uniref:Calpain catalytic domain-containing protein n=1 Tax=Ephemerocybe angulata TaxID=980116 RepID=A0A8H6LZ43_9AGAR|nr:hypothetical protein DFP72DRAFT_1075405 [Tulosesus angulatus]
MQRTEGENTPQTADTIYSKATKAELSRQFNQAFQHYIKAAELYLHLSRSEGSAEKDKVKWKASAQKALDRAERIKSFAEKSTARPKGSPVEDLPAGRDDSEQVRLAPVAINPFASHEIYRVLKKGGDINGLYFPLWDESSADRDSAESLFADPDGEPSLSPEQKAVSAIWRRPNLPPPNDSEIPVRILPQDILQHVVTDCSVCASISVCLEHSRRFGTHLKHPYTTTVPIPLLKPPVSYSGPRTWVVWISNSCSMARGEEYAQIFPHRAKYAEMCHFSVIDDQLPYDPQKGTLMCMSTLSPTPSLATLWPSLLEKAYMKLMGGYDFPGSNSCIDLHAIAGWIPEHIEIRRSDFERERTWERLSTGFASGQCMVTLGTGPSPVSMDDKIKLLPSHSYAVTDVFDGDDGRMITFLDSWVCPDAANEEARPKMPTIPWGDALNMFDGVYLSWDPEMWKNNLTFQGMWKRSDPEDVSKQLYLSFTRDHSSTCDPEEIWVLLTRHTADTRKTEAFIALKVQVEDELHDKAPAARQATCATETYTNSTHILVRTRLPSNERSGLISILASYDDGSATSSPNCTSPVGFTLSAYAPASTSIKWLETSTPPPYTSKVHGTVTHKTAGGNCTYGSFMVNPQYRLSILSPKGSKGSGKARTNLALIASKDMPVNVVAVWSGGKRVYELSEQDVIASSGAYTYGSARVTKDMVPGDSTIVVSAFDQQYLGPFTLKVECAFPFDLVPIPQEGAGMYGITVQGAWDKSCAGGSPGFSTYDRNPKYELNVPVLTKCIIRLQLVHPSATATRLNLTIYPSAPGSTKQAKHIATSGAYDDSLAGVVVPQTTLSPGKYLVVPSTYKPGVEAEFRMLCYFSTAGVGVRIL